MVRLRNIIFGAGLILWLLALLFVGSPGPVRPVILPAWAQNTICPTAPPGTSDNRCASTAFVQQAILGPGGLPPLLNNTTWVGNNLNTAVGLPIPTCTGANSALAYVPGTIGCNAALASLTAADQTLSGGANVTPPVAGAGSFTIDCGLGPLESYTNGGNATLTAPASSASCLILVTNNGSAGTLTLTGFTVGSNTGDAFDTTNGHVFLLQITRINTVSTYLVKALQ